MLSHSLDTYTELRIFEERFVDELLALVDKNRARLRTALPWVDAVRTGAECRAFAMAARQEMAAGRGVSLGLWQGGKLAGALSLRVAGDEPIAELSYWLGADYEGKGLITRAARPLLQHAFFALGVDRVFARITPANARGHAVAKRLGFRHEGHALHGQWLNGAPQDVDILALLAKEWRS